MSSREVTAGLGIPLVLTVTRLTPHTVVSQLWVRPAARSAWAHLPDALMGAHCTEKQDPLPLGSVTDGGQLNCVFTIRGEARSQYKVLITIDQGGKTCSGGSWVERGETNESGQAVIETELTFIQGSTADCA